MEYSCLAFYDQEEHAAFAFKKYWEKRASQNPRFLGYLLFNPDVHNAKWRSAKLLNFKFQNGRGNLIAFGIIANHQKNPVHNNKSLQETKINPKRLIKVTLPVQDALEILSLKGLNGLAPYMAVDISCN